MDDRGCAEIHASPLEPGAALPVAINLSASNLQDASLPGTIHDLQVALGLASGSLEITLTESVLMEDAEHALHIPGALRARNITLYIDDFGTGLLHCRADAIGTIPDVGGELGRVSRIRRLVCTTRLANAERCCHLKRRLFASSSRNPFQLEIRPLSLRCISPLISPSYAS